MHGSQDVNSVGTEERWNMHVLANKKIAFENYSNNRWLSGEPGGRAVADRTSVGPWEQWDMFGSGDGSHVSFKSAQGLWLTSQQPGNDTQWGGEVAADRQNAGPWEKFQMLPSNEDPMPNSWWSKASGVISQVGALVPIVVGAS